MRKRLSDERGGALLLTVVFMTVLLGTAAFAIDAGAWFRADRHLQATVDAAALAGAQALPADPDGAEALALEYSEKNGNPPEPDIRITTTARANDTIVVDATDLTEGFFSRVFSIDEVEVAAHAKAKVGRIGAARYVAPLVVSDEHPMLKCAKTNGPAACYGDEMTLTLTHQFADIAGAFGLITLNGDGNAGESTLADWLQNGFEDAVPVSEWYDSVPGAKFNADGFQDGLDFLIESDKDILVPVYSHAEGNGSNGRYFVVGFVVFDIESYRTQGTNSTMTGTFKGVVWTGIEATPRGGGDDFGVSVVRLVE